MKSIAIILSCSATALVVGYIAFSAGSRFGRNEAAHAAMNSRRMMGLAVSEIARHAKEGEVDALKRQAILLDDHWHYIAFVPNEHTPFNHRAENVATSILRFESPEQKMSLTR